MARTYVEMTMGRHEESSYATVSFIHESDEPPTEMDLYKSFKESLAKACGINYEVIEGQCGECVVAHDANMNYCPTCGVDVRHKSETPFVCGYDLRRVYVRTIFLGTFQTFGYEQSENLEELGWIIDVQTIDMFECDFYAHIMAMEEFLENENTWEENVWASFVTIVPIEAFNKDADQEIK